MKSLFISCHLDDAVFSCGKLISIIEHPTVLTVFGGTPTNKLVCTAYDQKSGFENAGQAIEQRRLEDAAALTLLGARQKVLDFVDHQYGEEEQIGDIRETINQAIQGYDEIYMPLGFKHHDHDLVGAYHQYFVKHNPDKKFYIFMDMPYYVDDPVLAAERLAKVEVDTQYAFRGGNLGQKMLAIACYKSQLPITNLYHLMADERYYECVS